MNWVDVIKKKTLSLFVYFCVGHWAFKVHNNKVLREFWKKKKNRKNQRPSKKNKTNTFIITVSFFFSYVSIRSECKTECYRAEIRKMTLLYKITGFCTLFLLINNFCMGKIESRLRVGKTINVFVRYGYLGISMKVISYNDTERWLFKEPTYNVFQVSVLNFPVSY